MRTEAGGPQTSRVNANEVASRPGEESGELDARTPVRCRVLLRMMLPYDPTLTSIPVVPPALGPTSCGTVQCASNPSAAQTEGPALLDRYVTGGFGILWRDLQWPNSPSGNVLALSGVCDRRERGLEDRWAEPITRRPDRSSRASIVCGRRATT